MRAMTILGNIVLTIVAVLGAVLFALPVIEEINDGRIAAVHGAGPASAAMVYVLLVPMLSSLVNGLPARLLAVAASAVAAMVTRTWVRLVEGGQVEAAVLLLAGAGVATACVLVLLRLLARQRRRRVSALARAHSVLAADIADGLRRRYAATAGRHDHDAPLPQIALIEHLVLGLIAEAATADDETAYARVLLEGLAEIEEGQGGDPRGYGAIALGEFQGRLRGDLRRRVPDAPPVRRRDAMRAA